MAKKYSKKAENKISKVMREFSRGELRRGKKGPGKGKKVKKPEVAKAIALSEARSKGLKVPKKKKK